MDLGDAIELIFTLIEGLCETGRLTCRLGAWAARLFRKPKDAGYLTIESNRRPAEQQGFRSITYSRRKPRLSRYVVR
jgi:hypothetical protein